MAWDLAQVPHSGLMVQLCGNADSFLISTTLMRPIRAPLNGMGNG
jgi:hypothetical protein